MIIFHILVQFRLGLRTAVFINYSSSAAVTSMICSLKSPGADLEGGRAGSAPPPFGDGPTYAVSTTASQTAYVVRRSVAQRRASHTVLLISDNGIMATPSQVIYSNAGRPTSISLIRSIHHVNCTFGHVS